ncbi:unnamed protein product [Lactuca saligna]|uniref:Uncharacterized protein n=1 Tax=Lactuca saligna TaxID=75948 RepID=A0AA35ZWR7_LACSI|nr:unnamed protein product [Lactuca saligna]
MNVDLDPFETVQETQFFSQLQPYFQSQPRRLLDESTDSFDKGYVEDLIQELYQELEVEPQAQKNGKGRARCTGWTDDEERWRATNRSAMEFNDINMNAVRTPQSGATKVNVMAKVQKIYKAKVGKAFANESFWRVVNDGFYT